MADISLKEYIARQQALRSEMASFLPGVKADCYRCDKKQPLSLINGDWLCEECWKWEVAYLQGRCPRTGALPPGAGNDRPAWHHDDYDYHGFGTPHTLGRKRKGEK